MTGRAIDDSLAREPEDQTDEHVILTLRILRPGLSGCAHRYRTWGHDPGVITCTCGARWRAVLPRPRANERFNAVESLRRAATRRVGP